MMFRLVAFQCYTISAVCLLLCLVNLILLSIHNYKKLKKEEHQDYPKEELAEENEYWAEMYAQQMEDWLWY